MSAIEPLATHVAIVLDGRLATFGPLDELRCAYAEQSLEKIYHRIAKSARTLPRALWHCDARQRPYSPGP